MKTSIVAVMALALCAAGALTASAEAARIVDLEECLRLGFTNDAGLRSGELQTRIADARLREMQGQYLPSVALQGSYSRLSDVTPGSMNLDLGASIGSKTVTFPAPLVNSTSLGIAVQQPLFTGHRIASSIRQAQAMRDSDRGDLARSRLDLRFTITEAYWSFAKARTQELAITQSVAQAETHLADARNLLDQGMATNNDVLQAQMRLEDAQIELASAGSFHQMARVRLAQLVGLPWNTNLDIPADIPQTIPQIIPPRPGKLEDLVARALAARPEIQGARSRVSAGEASVDLARSGLFPSIFLTGGCTLADPNQRVFPQADQFIGTWSVGIAASIDIGRFPQVAAQQEQAQSRLAQAQENSRKLADLVIADVVRAYLAVNEAAGRFDALHKETAQTEENDRVTQERYRQGVALSSESLDAQAMLVRARLREDGALFDFLVARAALERAAGE